MPESHPDTAKFLEEGDTRTHQTKQLPSLLTTYPDLALLTHSIVGKYEHLPQL